MDLWICGFVDLWICGFVDLWICGFVDLWICGFVDLWICGFVDLWICGFVDLWICGFVDLWICGFVDLWIRPDKAVETTSLNRHFHRTVGHGQLARCTTIEKRTHNHSSCQTHHVAHGEEISCHVLCSQL